MNAISVDRLTHRYGTLVALNDLSLEVAPGRIFGLLGPNGGGKSTLFRVLSTLQPPQAGTVRILGQDVRADSHAVRRMLGVTFQHPSLDRRLTVGENLTHHGRLYGLTGSPLRTRIREVLEQLGLWDRHSDKCESLSGGMQRRVEVAKGLLHRPRVLLLDEPSTGLDPGARLDLWTCFQKLRAEGITLFLTTHLMEEAERCEELAILHRGELVAQGTPESLTSAMGGHVVSIRVADPAAFAADLNATLAESPPAGSMDRTGLSTRVVGRDVRVEGSPLTAASAASLVSQILERHGAQVDSIAIARPTLEDVFVRRTGRRFHEESA